MTVPALNIAIDGQGVIDADNLNSFLQGGAVASELRAITGLPNMTVMLGGIQTINDGQAGFYYWNPFGTEPDDNFSYITPVGTFQGQWVRIALPSTQGDLVFTDVVITDTLTVDGVGRFNSSVGFYSDVAIAGLLATGFADGLVAAGTSQATAKLIANNNNAFTTVPAGTGALLPAVGLAAQLIAPGVSIRVYNRGANNLLVYPQPGSSIENLAVNAPVVISTFGVNTFTNTGIGGVKWYIS